MKHKFLCVALTVMAGMMFVSCDDSFEDSIKEYSVNIDANLPTADVNLQLDEAKIEFHNLSSGLRSRFDYPLAADVRIPAGLYDIYFSAETLLPGGGAGSVKGVARSVEIMSAGVVIPIDLYVSATNDDLIISEVFFAGTLQNSGNQYYGDDYVKLYNNTDHVVYADGITLFESKFLTTQKLIFNPDIMSEAVTVEALYTIPGSGTEHPVQPGEYILLADVGIDHRTVNPNSFDLSHADWEWYDISTKPNNLDIDSPLVENLDKWYCYTLSFWLLHNRGFKAYGIARIPIDKEQYLSDYWYSYDYDLVTQAGTFPMTQSAYRLPNEWVVDVVNCSVESEWQWNVTAPSLDMGWTYCGTIDKDKTRYFHSVRRKLSHIDESGRPIFKDTNNSAEDFNPFVVPSEIELQHTPTGIGQPNSQIITYDGVVPVE